MSQSFELILNRPGERLDRALAESRPELSRAQWQKLIKEGQVLWQSRPVKASLLLRGGEQLTITIPDQPGESALVGQNLPLEIRYDDENVLVINKPAGMVVHPGAGREQGTLVHAVLGYCPNLPLLNGESRPGIVHRLDKESSGLILVAKNESALHQLQSQFKRRTVKKVYLALVEGHIQPPQALIDAPIGRDTRQRKRMSVISPNITTPSRPAQTSYQLLQTIGDFSLIECRPLTGRTHQIRVHLAYLGYPIVGDRVYGRRKQRLTLDRHFLHATTLTFKLPGSGRELTCHSDLPPELQALLNQLS